MPPVTVSGTRTPMAIAGRLIGVSVVIGTALGLAAVMFLVLTGFFDEPDDLGDIGTALFGGVILVGVVAFALLVGIVMAGIDGVVAARLASNVTDARVAAAIAGAVGHLGLVMALGAVLTVGFLIFQGGGSDAAPTPTPVDLAECFELFGADSQFCADQGQTQEDDSSSSVPWDDILKALGGVIPAGLAGAGAASLMHRLEG
jgi:hypothetical protein